MYNNVKANLHHIREKGMVTKEQSIAIHRIYITQTMYGTKLLALKLPKNSNISKALIFLNVAKDKIKQLLSKTIQQ